MIDGTTVIDFHGHVGRWEYLGMLDDPIPMLRAMDAVGIDRACVFNIFHPEGTRANDCTATFVAKHPDRFIGFAYVSPLMPETMVPELERAIDMMGLSAIKIYPTYTPYCLNHPAWHPIYQFAHDRELVIISHTSSQPDTTHPKYLGEAAALFPNAKFVAAHAGNTAPRASSGDTGVPQKSEFLCGNLLNISYTRRYRRTGRRKLVLIGYSMGRTCH